MKNLSDIQKQRLVKAIKYLALAVIIQTKTIESYNAKKN